MLEIKRQGIRASLDAPIIVSRVTKSLRDYKKSPSPTKEKGSSRTVPPFLSIQKILTHLTDNHPLA